MRLIPHTGFILKSSKFQLYIINMNKKIPIWLLGPYGSSIQLNAKAKGGDQNEITIESLQIW